LDYCTTPNSRDSLIKRYLDEGALKYDYNSVTWQIYCDSLIALCPNIAVAYQLKAIPYLKYADYDKAFKLEDRAVELDPINFISYRGFLKCIFTKDYEGSLRDFKKALVIAPGRFEMDHSYFFYMGLCNLELANYREAELNFRKDISVQTGKVFKWERIHFNTLFYSGILYYKMNRNTKAKEYLLKCLEQYKEMPCANYYLALVYKKESNTRLKNKYLQIAKSALEKHYGMNEGNIYYANYPKQIHLNEVLQEISNNKVIKEGF